MSDKEELTRELAEVFDADKIESVVKKRPMPNRGHQKGKIKATSQDVDLMKERVIHLLRQGKTRQEAMSEVDRNPRTYYSWAWADSRFEQRAQAAMKDFETAKVRSNMTFAQIRDEFEPVKRENYNSWTEYVVAFRKAYFGFDTFDHQWQILQAWENSPPGGISLILVPPEAGKTTLLADTIVADLCSDPNTRRSLVSEGQDLARKTMGRIQRRLVYDGGDMPALISHFGPFVPTAADRGKKWNADEFTILASNHDEADPSCVSVGAGSNIRGARWDAVDLDDIQSIKSVNKTSWLLDIFRGDIVTRPGKDGRIRITGSRVARGDFYEELERLDLVDEIVVIPALDLTKPLGHQSYFPLQYREDGTPVLDEKGKHMGWSDAELLQRKKKVGDDMWSRVYMMRPQSDFAALLTAEDIAQASDHDRIVGQTPKNAVATMASLDPSLAAYAAFTYSAYNADHLYVMEVKNYFRPNTNQNLFAEIYRGSKFYHPSWWVIENNTLQRGYLTDDAFIAIKKEFGFQSVGHHTGDNKQDPQLGVPAMMEAIRRGEIRFPRVTEHDTDFATLFDQLLAWRPDIPTKRLTQDLVMSLWFSYLRWKQLRQVLDTDLSGWKRDGLGSITLYAGARTNLEGVDTAPHPHVLETYDQVWNRLTAKEPA